MVEKELAQVVGENITARRKKLGISQKELALAVDVTQDAMVRMEKGRIAPKMTRLQQIAEALKCPVAYLFRTHDELTEERAATIAELMHGLPEDGQEALVDLVAMAAKVMKR